MAMNDPNRRKSKNNYDPASVDSNTYNDAAGARKISNAGHNLKPIQLNGSTYTTNIVTARLIGKGKTLAIYNNTAGALSVTLGDSAVAALAIGAVSGESVGIAVPPNSYLYLNTYVNDYIIGNSASLICYIVTDDTFMEARR